MCGKFFFDQNLLQSKGFFSFAGLGWAVKHELRIHQINTHWKSEVVFSTVEHLLLVIDLLTILVCCLCIHVQYCCIIGFCREVDPRKLRNCWKCSNEEMMITMKDFVKHFTRQDKEEFYKDIFRNIGYVSLILTRVALCVAWSLQSCGVHLSNWCRYCV